MDHHTRHLPRLTALLLGLALAFTGQTASASDLTLYYPDAQGSPVAAADINGNILWRKHYEPYGKDANGVADDVGYTGHEHDAETGLTYMQARYQDPTSGRFYGIDPVGFKPGQPMTFNRYSYANNNPYKYVDPDGRIVVYAGSQGDSTKIQKLVSKIITTKSGSKQFSILAASENVYAIRLGRGQSSFIAGGSYTVQVDGQEVTADGLITLGNGDGKTTYSDGHKDYIPQDEKLVHEAEHAVDFDEDGKFESKDNCGGGCVSDREKRAISKENEYRKENGKTTDRVEHNGILME